MAWAKISRATKSKLRKNEDFNTTHMLSKTSRLRKFILKQELEQNFKKRRRRKRKKKYKTLWLRDYYIIICPKFF